jgi:ParB-like chromosome segregation protein Spo0J
VLSEQVGRNIVRIPLSSIRADEKNPRKTFQEVDQLAESIQKTTDIEVPIIVEDLGGKNYFLVDGERRLRAARKAGLTYIWADVRQSLGDVERGIIRAKLNFQHWNWETGEGVKQLNGLYDAWLESKKEARPNESRGRREEFERLIGISQASLREKLAFGDSAVRAHTKSTPALRALEDERMTFEAARKIASHKPADQRAIIERAEELRLSRETPPKKITETELVQAKREYAVTKTESKEDKDGLAYKDIVLSYRRMVDQATEIRDRSRSVYKADTAREVMEMMEALGKTFVNIEEDLKKRFPAVEPRRVSR